MTRQYIGARYVTKIYENSLDPSSSEWEAGINWEPLIIVTYNNGSYMSKKFIPASVGNPADNPQYWTQTGFYNGQIASLDARVTDLEEGVYFVTPEMFGAVGDGVTDDSLAISDAIDYGHTNHIPVKLTKHLVDGRIRFRGDISEGELILSTNAEIIVSDDINEPINIHNIKFDVTGFSGTALYVRSNHTNIYNCSFKGEITPSNVICILAEPYVNSGDPFYVDTYKGIWGIHIYNNFFYGVETCIKIYTPNDAQAWISDAEITENTGFWHHNSIVLECDNPNTRSNISGIEITGNAFSDNFTSATNRYGLKITDVNGRVNSINNKFFSDGDDTNYYGYYMTNSLRTVNDSQGDMYDKLLYNVIGGLARNRGTDGKMSIPQGLNINTSGAPYPKLEGIAKNILFKNNITDVGTTLVYADNVLTFNNNNVPNAQITIPIPSDMESSNGYFMYIAECDWDTSWDTGKRMELLQVNGSDITYREEIPWPNPTKTSYFSGGFEQYSGDFENTLKLRFYNFPNGTYKLKRLIIFNEMVSGFKDFTLDFTDLSMFDY